MDLTGGSRATAVAAGAALAGGLLVVLYGIVHSDVAQAMGGTCLAITALTLVALVLIRKWIVDTSKERAVLAADQHAAQAERARYVALQAAQENEQGRFHKAMAAERARIATQLKVEREAMEAEFEEQRATLAVETMEATFMMIHNGEFAAESRAESKVIQFRDHQQRQPERERERSRGHGVVGP